MNCEQWKDLLLTEYLDGVLGPEKQKACDEHLSQCAECRRLVSDLRAVTQEIFGQAQVMQPPAGVWEGIAEKLQSSPGWLEKVRAVLTLPRLGAAIPVLAALLLFFLIQQKQPSRRYEATRDYLVQELGGEFVLSSNGDTENGGFGTVIEDFFM